ncbi:MAG: TetR/AcrR family transcriptional regulator [Acidobacteriia bacterium]|nr:TetR/AcrR family transcriptional regulator [Terriglobia bacterium]
MNSLNPVSFGPQSRRIATAKPGAVALQVQARRKRDRAGKQQALIQAALRLFATKGYEATTTREIAASANCAEGLIHRYFGGKAGLLPALVEDQISKEVVDLGHRVQPAPTMEEEFIQLVVWEVERMWENREYLGVFIPRAIVDPSVRNVLHRAVLSIRVEAVAKRLRRYKGGASLSEDELAALSESVGVLGLVFGFMRPMVLGQDRSRAKEMAAITARMLIQRR